MIGVQGIKQVCVANVAAAAGMEQLRIDLVADRVAVELLLPGCRSPAAQTRVVCAGPLDPEAGAARPIVISLEENAGPAAVIRYRGTPPVVMKMLSHRRTDLPLKLKNLMAAGLLVAEGPMNTVLL